MVLASQYISDLLTGPVRALWSADGGFLTGPRVRSRSGEGAFSCFERWCLTHHNNNYIVYNGDFKVIM